MAKKRKSRKAQLNRASGGASGRERRQQEQDKRRTQSRLKEAERKSRIDLPTDRYGEVDVDALFSHLDESFNEGNLMYTRITNMIEAYPYGGGKYLSNMLKSDVSRFGKDKVMKAMANLPSSEIDRVESILYYVGNKTSEEAHNDLRAFAEAIKASILSEEELKEVGDIIEQESSYDMDY